MKFRLTNCGSVDKINDDGTLITSFNAVAGSVFLEEYQQWLADGNTPEPADPVILPPRMKDKEDIFTAVVALGKAEALLAFFAANPVVHELWIAGRQAVSADPPDQRVVGALTAAGLSESEITTVLGA